MFPFHLPSSTSFYLVLYLGTLVLHVMFMGYVLAGSAYLAMVILLGRDDRDNPVTTLLRSWLPFMLSMAITAGVAPLLFIQLLYRTEFYTANLLLFNRWMAVLPALITGFYLLYLLKNRWADGRSRWLAVSIAVLTFVCFGFVAWSWTENHLLSLEGQEGWTEQYTGGSLIFHSAQLLPRLGIWFCGTFSILSLWLSWQLWWPHRWQVAKAVPQGKQVTAMGIVGLLTATACCGVYWLVMPAAHRDSLADESVMPYAVLAGACLLGQLIILWRQYAGDELCPKRLTLLSGLSLLMLVSVAVLREALRVASVDMTELVAHHQYAANVGGWWVFVTFLVLNSLGIAWCLKMVLEVPGPANSKTTETH